MKLKSELYKNEQNTIIDEIINILELNDEKSIILYHLDKDISKQTKIINLIPIIRKFFSFSKIIGVSNPDKTKRPYLSIIRQITKLKYNMKSFDYRIKQKEGEIRTKKYVFTKK
jgi:hypothetical protein